MERASSQPLELFYCYAHEDRALRDKLNKHLAILGHQHLINVWYDGAINPGTPWEKEIANHLNAADIILLLISANFIASEYCYHREITRAIERHHANEARVIPVLLRPVDWKGASFSQLQMLPSNGRPITSWSNQDKAYMDVTQGIRRVVTELLVRRGFRIGARGM